MKHSHPHYRCHICKLPIMTLVKRMLGQNAPFICLDCWRAIRPARP